MSRQKKSFIATWNNYPDADPDTARDPYADKITGWGLLHHMYTSDKTFKYIIAGKEVGENGTPHLQMHIKTKRGITISALQKKLQSYEIRLALMLPESQQHADNNIAYCKKDGDYKEWGVCSEQGKRNDLTEYMDAIKANPKKRKLEIMEEFPTVYAKYPKFANEYRLLKQNLEIIQGDLKERNQWIYGPPGTGKSRPWQEAGCFSKPANKWWDGYDGEDVVLIEDFDYNCDKLAHLLKIWLDRYPFHAEVKGTMVKIRPQRIIITSNYHPDEIFKDEMLCDALMRRFEIVQKFA